MDAVGACIGCPGSDLKGGPTSWRAGGIAEATIRAAIAEAAKSKNNAWFKTFELGEELGKLAVNVLPDIPGTDLAKKIEQIESWAYAG